MPQSQKIINSKFGTGNGHENMIESVKVRHRGAVDFAGHYDNLCALQSSCPLPAVKAHLSESVLDINGDRIRFEDWNPILATLSINKTLSFVAIRSYHQQNQDDQAELTNAGIKKKPSAIRSHDITYKLCKSLRECLSGSTALTTVELQGLILREKDLHALYRGITKSTTLKHFTVEYCPIGDKGVEILVRGVKNCFSVTSVNFTGCAVSGHGCEMLADMVRHQAIKRHNEAWQGSLRYKKPDLDRMAGIRRITVNANPLIGDKGAKSLAEALKDDLWLKALDLQRCGLTDDGAKILLDVLKINTTIVVLDLRQNPMIEKETIRNIMEHVLINSNGQDTEYKWIKADTQPQDPLKMKSKKRRTKMLQSNFGKKTTVKVTNSSLARRRSRSTGSMSKGSPSFHNQHTKGVPWRTAQRADRYAGYPPDMHYGQEDIYESDGSPPGLDPETTITLDYSDSDDHTYINEEQVDINNKKQVQVEIERLHRRFKEESSARAKAEERVLELTVENRRLHQDLELLQQNGGLLDDDKVLESIEATFKQFHAFLDLLGDAGLGDLISMAGLDQSLIPFASFRNQLEQSMNQTRSAMHDQSQLIKNGQKNQRPSSSHKDQHYVSSNQQHIPSDITINPVSDDSHIAVNSVYPPSNGSSILGQSAIPTDEGPGEHLNMLAQNYENLPDPTMIYQGDNFEENAGQKFDDLYQKVLRDAEGALQHKDVTSILKNQGVSLHRTSGMRTVEGGESQQTTKRPLHKPDSALDLSDSTQAEKTTEHYTNSHSTKSSADKSAPPKPTPRMSRREQSSPDKSLGSVEYSETFEPTALSISAPSSSSSIHKSYRSQNHSPSNLNQTISEDLQDFTDQSV